MCQLWYHWHVEELLAVPKLKRVFYANLPIIYLLPWHIDA